MHVTASIFCQRIPTKQKSTLWVHCPRPKHDAENYIFAMEALAYLGSLWKSDRKFILPVLQI